MCKVVEIKPSRQEVQEEETVCYTMKIGSRTKHTLHCTLFLSIIFSFEYLSGVFRTTSDSGVGYLKPAVDMNPWVKYGTVGACVLYALRLVIFLPLPQTFFNFVGLIIYNAFADKVTLKGAPLLAPLICFRVVTRGDFPEMVKRNVNRNMAKCLDIGLENFFIEVVSDKFIGIKPDARVRELIVPSEYQTPSGALFKARALQYCLEEKVNILDNSDWIVHLDEETLLTEDCIKGILNFIIDAKHHIGQGLITYANEEVVNWLTTLIDGFRVTDDMGKLRLQFRMFHKPLFSFKGSYVVTQVGTEKAVSFDNGSDGSIAEDCYFAIKAYTMGYTFDFIEGEMWEKSPFTITDFIQQRKRWIQGILLVIHSKKLPIKYKMCLTLSCYAWVTLPLSTSNLIIAPFFPVPCPAPIDFLMTFVGAVNIYMYIFGVVRSFNVRRYGIAKFCLCLAASVAVLPFNLIIENIAVIWGYFGKKHKFYVVKKSDEGDVIV